LDSAASGDLEGVDRIDRAGEEDLEGVDRIDRDGEAERGERRRGPAGIDADPGPLCAVGSN
jgi:hypothetical protein